MEWFYLCFQRRVLLESATSLTGYHYWTVQLFVGHVKCLYGRTDDRRECFFVISANRTLLWFLLTIVYVNPLNAELNLICHLLALLGAHPILHVSRIRVKQPVS